MKASTDGQKMLNKARRDLGWAITFLDETSTPGALDVDALVKGVRDACIQRLRERGVNVGPLPAERRSR